MKILEPEVVTKIRYPAGMRCRQEKGLKTSLGLERLQKSKICSCNKLLYKNPRGLGDEAQGGRGRAVLSECTQQGVMEQGGRGEAGTKSTWAALIRACREWNCNGLEGAK